MSLLLKKNENYMKEINTKTLSIIYSFYSNK